MGKHILMGHFNIKINLEKRKGIYTNIEEILNAYPRYKDYERARWKSPN